MTGLRRSLDRNTTLTGSDGGQTTALMTRCRAGRTADTAKVRRQAWLWRARRCRRRRPPADAVDHGGQQRAQQLRTRLSQVLGETDTVDTPLRGHRVDSSVLTGTQN